MKLRPIIVRTSGSSIKNGKQHLAAKWKNLKFRGFMALGKFKPLASAVELTNAVKFIRVINTSFIIQIEQEEKCFFIGKLRKFRRIFRVFWAAKWCARCSQGTIGLGVTAGAVVWQWNVQEFNFNSLRVISVEFPFLFDTRIDGLLNPNGVIFNVPQASQFSLIYSSLKPTRVVIEFPVKLMTEI